MKLRWALAGFSGSGKSTVAALLARSSGRRLVDLDEMIGAARIREMLAADERLLRRAEAEALRGLAAEPADVVVALGGGALEGAATRQVLGRGFLVAWLDAPLATCLERCAAQPGTRPLLERVLEEGAEATEEFHRHRARAARTTRVRVDAGRPPDEVAQDLLRLLREAENEADQADMPPT